MKTKKLPYVKTSYNFVAPIVEAKVSRRILQNSRVNKLLDLNAFLADDAENIFLVRVSGDSMVDANIYEDDILVVNKNEKASNGKIIIASLNGELTVKYYRIINKEAYLVSANKKYLPIKISEFFQFEIQGVVKHIIRNL